MKRSGVLTRRQAIAILSAGAVSCCPNSEGRGSSSPDPGADPQLFNACRRTEDNRLKVLTWNIFMMPGWLHDSPRNEPRAKAIAAVLLEQDFEILCFQKAFDAGARNVLREALGARYPHQYGPANDCGSLKLNSGVWVLSRYPLAGYREIEFSDCASVECLSRKGAILLSGSCGANRFQLITTHLQGEEGSKFTPEHQRIRDLQTAEIRDRLISPYLESNVPLFICGDFGTPRLTADGARETAEYRRMLQTLGADDAGQVLLTLDESTRNNGLARDETGRVNQLDYILLRGNGSRVAVERERHIFRQGGWDSPTDRSDLSYRYALGAELTFAGDEAAVGTKSGR